MLGVGFGWWGRVLKALPLVVSLVSTLGGACSVKVEPAREAPEVDETCEPGVRNQEWDVDCSAACTHVMACRSTTSDSDLRTLSCSDCLGSCVAGVSLGGNDLVEGTDEDRRSWVCAALVEGCSALDHNCDIF